MTTTGRHLIRFLGWNLESPAGVAWPPEPLSVHHRPLDPAKQPCDVLPGEQDRQKHEPRRLRPARSGLKRPAPRGEETLAHRAEAIHHIQPNPVEPSATVRQRMASGDEGEAGIVPDTTRALSGTLSEQALLQSELSFRLHSAPAGICPIIYLDFDGHTTTGTAWNSNSGVSSYDSPAYDIDSNPSSFGSQELTQIQQIWQRVAADFAPFAVDVTTQEPPSEWLSKTSTHDSSYGIRVVITSAGPYFGGSGTAYLDSFTWDTDTPAFIYTSGVISIAEVISHEVGHSLGLSHDGSTTAAYYGGHGSGEEGWAPIMGSSSSKNVTTWDDGTYAGSSNNTVSANGGKGPDDLYVITNYNGFNYSQDAEGDSVSSAVLLSLANDSFGIFGTIQSRHDQDYFRFSIDSPSTLTLSADPYWSRAFVNSDGLWGGSETQQLGPVSDVDPLTTWSDHGANLDLSVEILSTSGDVIAASNPIGLRAGFEGMVLPAGEYVIRLDGVGSGDPSAASPTGYSDYGSIGNYWLSGTLRPNAQPPILSVGDLRVMEGSSGKTNTVQLDVRLSAAASEDVHLTVLSRDATATSTGKNADFKPISNVEVIIPKGQLSATLPVLVSADLRSEPDEKFSLEFTSIRGAILERSSSEISIINDDMITGGGKKSAIQTIANAEAGKIREITGMHRPDPITGMNRVAESWPWDFVQGASSSQRQGYDMQGHLHIALAPVMLESMWERHHMSGISSGSHPLSRHNAEEKPWLFAKAELHGTL